MNRKRKTVSPRSTLAPKASGRDYVLVAGVLATLAESGN